MSARVRKVVNAFLELSRNEQELAIEEIETAFEREDAPEEVEKAWAEVIELRARDVLAGRSIGRDAFEALDEIRQRLQARGMTTRRLVLESGVEEEIEPPSQRSVMRTPTTAINAPLQCRCLLVMIGHREDTRVATEV